MEKKYISVAIDGPSGAGKSTMARAAAGRFGFAYLDTGAIYRTLGLAALRSGVSAEDTGGIIALMPSADIRVSYDGSGRQHMLLDGEDVSSQIRTEECSQYTSAISAIPEVRAFLMDTQRDVAARCNVIMDGRDIGTVVLPGADVKIFLTASPEVRAGRRLLEEQRTKPGITLEQVLRDINIRDARDSERAAAPLRAAEDAVVIDTSEMSPEESVEAICREIARVTEA